MGAAMPVMEIVPTLRGRSSWSRWRVIAEHLAIAVAMTAVGYATFRLLPVAVLPSAATIGGMSPLVVTVLLFATYLVGANLVALLVRGELRLPVPKPPPTPEEPGTGKHAAGERG